MSPYLLVVCAALVVVLSVAILLVFGYEERLEDELDRWR